MAAPSASPTSSRKWLSKLHHMQRAFISYSSFFRFLFSGCKTNISSAQKFDKVDWKIERWIPCRSGMCSTPMHVTSSQLIASEIFPAPVVKALLYPGAIVNGLVNNMTIPRWDDVLNIYNLTDAKEASAIPDLQRLEVLAGSYFSVAGALIGILKPGRMGMFGTLLIIWGLVKEGILGKPANTDPTKAVFVCPTMLIAVVCAFSSIKYDAKKIGKSAPARPAAQPLKSSKKSKLR